jgi:IS30 family transposase
VNSVSFSLINSLIITNLSNSVCDNGPEFKAQVNDLAKNLGIQIVRGQAYHPQSQGSVEIANRTFKRRLAALQLARGVSTW